MAEDAIRIDKWLWHARVTKTRSLAQKLVSSGKVRVNRTKVLAPGRAVRVGDTLTISLPRHVVIYRIAAIAGRRGPYAEARELYVNLSERSSRQPEFTMANPSADTGRPDKRQRRAIAVLRGKNT